MENSIPILEKNFCDKLKKLLGLAFVLSLTTIIIHLYRIEYLGSFDEYFPAVAFAVFLHNIAPFRFRKYLFSLWTLLILSLTAGPIYSLVSFGIIIAAVAITFISKRIFRNSMAAFLLASMIAARTFSSGTSYINGIITLAGIFIMLRYIFLLYEISYIKIKPSFLLRVNYLFMLPNIFFPLFPIVDPLIFFKNKEEDSNEAILLGKTWLTRGILHLLFYRFIYLYFTPSIYELHTWYNLLAFFLSGYSLILRLSGIFYLSGGILSLMGYKLPPVFEDYFLVRNFRDLWRRINLYWRHFMWRVFYSPIFFQLKKWPQKRAVFVTVIIAFAITWFLHCWQWYWIKGVFPLFPNDILYWTLFGLILAFVSVHNLTKTKSLDHGKPFLKGMKIIFMFIAMSTLWSFWTASSLTEWMYFVSKFSKLNAKGIIYLILSIAGIFLLGGMISMIQFKTKMFSFLLNGLGKTSSIVILILLIGIGLFYKTEKHFFPLPFSKIVDPQLNMTDRVIVERGYYEQLMVTTKMNQELQPIFRKAEVNDFQNVAYQTTNGLLPRILKPNFHTTFKGKIFSTNSFGMRDKEYSLIKKQGCLRICLLGSSYEMGSGVADGETFEQLIEDSLNNKNIPCEILNMGIGGYHAFQMLQVAETKSIQYHPDVMIYVCHSSEKQRMINNILSLVANGKDLEFPYLKNIVKASGIIPEKMCQVEMYDRLYLYADTLLKYVYHEFGKTCVENNILPIWIYLPVIGDLREDQDYLDCITIAKQEEFEIIDLSGIYDGKDIDEITVSDEDAHPNKIGHFIIAHVLEPKIQNIITEMFPRIFN